MLIVHSDKILGNLGPVIESMNKWKDIGGLIPIAESMKAWKDIGKPISMVESMNAWKDMGQLIPNMESVTALKGMGQLIPNMESVIALKGMGQLISNMESVTALKDIGKSISMVESMNAWKDIGKPISMMQIGLIGSIGNNTKSLLGGLSPVQTKEFYEELVKTVKENESIPDELVENDDAINVYSLEEFKQLCYKIITGVMIILVSSALTWEEIEKVLRGIFDFFGFASATKSLVEKPIEEKQIINNYHIHVGSNEEAMEIIQKIKESND